MVGRKGPKGDSKGHVVGEAGEVETHWGEMGRQESGLQEGGVSGIV